MPFLKVFTHGEERTVFLGDDPIVFGRGDDVDVFLKDVKVSREHCVIERDEDGNWRVLDLQSGNGTRVNGTPVKSHVLTPEDVVEVGDAKVLFAAEAAAVVVENPPVEPPPPRRARTSAPSRGPYLVAAIVLVGLVALALLWQSRRDAPAPAEKSAGTRPAPVAQEPVPDAGARTAEEIARSLPADLDVYGRLALLEKMQAEAAETDAAAMAEAIRRARAAVEDERERFFGGLEAVFRAQLEEGQFARAREIWFFLHEDANWSPLPTKYRDRIIRAMTDLELRAAAARTGLLDDVTRAQEAVDFDHAEKLIRESLPRFAGTSVERSLDERLAEIELARRRPADLGPRTARTRVRADTRKQMEELLARLSQRDFAAVAAGLEALVAETPEKDAREELARRAGEVAAAAELQAAVVAELAAGKAPTSQIAKRWRVLAGDGKGITVRIKGEEVTWPWTEVPPRLHLALLGRHGAGLGLAVAAHGIGAPSDLVEALALAYADGKPHPDVDRFLAEVVRNEPLPEGGYVVFEGEVLPRAEFVRKREEALIAQYRAQLDKAYEAIRADRAIRKIDKLAARKDELDKRRAYALELIFDEKKYFYPYRDRSNEYYPVQKEVDERVARVVEVWDDSAQTKVGLSDAMKRQLKSFDEAAAELTKRFVDIDEKRAEVDFLRSYLGRKFTVRTLYRTPEERELLEYSDEVMEWNTQVKGDITAIEREQVRVTNEYRKMFGRWPVRLVEKLVLSSRGHCEEMSRLGYFGHFSPTPGRKTPYDRMRLAGYTYGASENCVMGTSDPKSAHERWCHSSGHHRNLLMAAWTEMGTGHYGSLMTQNFGRAPKWTTTPPAAETPGETAGPDDDGSDGGDAKDKKDPYDYEGED